MGETSTVAVARAPYRSAAPRLGSASAGFTPYSVIKPPESILTQVNSANAPLAGRSPSSSSTAKTWPTSGCSTRRSGRASRRPVDNAGAAAQRHPAVTRGDVRCPAGSEHSGDRMPETFQVPTSSVRPCLNARSARWCMAGADPRARCALRLTAGGRRASHPQPARTVDLR